MICRWQNTAIVQESYFPTNQKTAAFEAAVFAIARVINKEMAWIFLERFG